jgi:hypothetical protein
MPTGCVTYPDPARVWPRFKRECGGSVWIDPVLMNTVEVDEDGVVDVRASRFEAPIADIADRLGIVLEGINDTPASGTGEDESPEMIELAAGQVWADEEGFKAVVDAIEGDQVRYRITETPEGAFYQDNPRGKPMRRGVKAFHHYYPSLISPAPAASPGPVPLAVGQVWKGGTGYVVEIDAITDGWIRYHHRSSGEAGDLSEAYFRTAFPEFIPPPPSRDDLIDLLVAGKRLRFERDPASDCRGPWRGFILGVLEMDKYHRGVFRDVDGVAVLTTPGIATGRDDAAVNALGLAAKLGYRFERIAVVGE